MDYFITRLEENSKQYADKPAISNGGEDWYSYSQVWELSGRVYQYLKNKKLGREDFVMVNLPRGAATIEVCIGVWRAGAAFVICEAGYSKERTDFIYDDCNCKLKIDESVLNEILTVAPLEGYETTNPHDAAYACYTSGSTGVAKGVLHEYGVLEQDIYCHIFDGKYDTNCNDIYAMLSPLNFVAVLIVFPSILFVGGKLVIVPTNIVKNPQMLEEFYRKEKITASFITPSLMTVFKSFNPQLRLVYSASEPVKNVYLENIEMYNVHAQSETGFLTTAFRIDKPYENTPIGKTNVPDLNIRICDENSKEVPNGEIGEICFDNIYFRGYINQKELTEEVFRDGVYHTGDMGKVLEDGNIVLLGRADDMVKINGNRVEPREIEEVVKKVINVDWVLVKCVEHEGTKHIVVYIKDEPEMTLSEAREIIALKLPYYMVPSHYVLLDEIPVNDNGKIARNRLPEPDFNSVAAYAAPRDAMERKLTAIIGKVLGRTKIGIDDDFYELGGDSILSMEVAVAIGTSGFTTEDLFRERTVRKMAEYIRKISVEDKDTEKYKMVKEYAKKGCKLTAYQQFFFDRQCITPKSRMSTMLNLPIMLRFSGVDTLTLCKAVRKAIHAHPMMLSKLEFDSNDELLQRMDESLYEEIVPKKMTKEEFEECMLSIVQPFKLIGNRLYNIQIFEVEEYVYLFIDVHHIISDGTSLHILLSDIKKAYLGENLKKDYVYGYLKRVESRIGDRYYNECKEYLTRAYDGDGWDTCPKRDHEPKQYTPGYMEKELNFNRNLFAKVKAKLDISDNAIFIMITLITLAKYNDCGKVKITWTYHGRDSQLKSNMFGLLIKDLVIAVRLDNGMKFSEVAMLVDKQIAGGIAHSVYPYSLLYDTSYDNDCLCFLFQDDLYDFTGGSQFDVKAVPVPRQILTAENSFSVQIITNADEYLLGINYLSECYEGKNIRRFIEIFSDNLNKFLSNVDGEIYEN